MSEVEKNRDVKRNNGSCRYFNVLISCEFRQLFRKVHLRWFPTLWIRTLTNCRGDESKPSRVDEHSCHTVH